MKQIIVVRKCKSHRIFSAVFSLVLLGILTGIMLPLGKRGLILYPPFLLILVPLNLYFFTWQIRLEPKVIVKKLFFREVVRYGYSQLEEVVSRYSMAERDRCIILIFRDKKLLSFCKRDENYAAAYKYLSHRHSIKAK